MTAVALMSAKGAPGVTTSAVVLAAVWPTPAVLVEADPAGGDLRSWYRDPSGQPLRADVGVVSLLAAHTPSGTLTDRGLQAHTQLLPGGLPVLVGPGAPAQATALRGLWPQLAVAVAAHDGDVVLDLGRVAGSQDVALAGPLLSSCAATLVVCRASVASIMHTRDLLAQPHLSHGRADVLVVGSRTDRTDVATALGVPEEQVHQLPFDATAAAAVAGEWTRRLDRSPLVAAGRRLSSAFYARAQAPSTQHPPSTAPALVTAVTT